MPASKGTARSADRAPVTTADAANRRATFNSVARFSLRMTASALAAYFLAQVVPVPLHGLWAVLTAVIVTQASVGGSIRASLEYVLGTFVGAVYATLVSLLVPHGTAVTMGAVLALSIAPLAYAAARSSIFRVAPFTAVIVLLLAGEFSQGPITAAMTRLLEVALGGAVAVLVSLLIFPERAYGRGKQAAITALERLAHAMPLLMAGLSKESKPADLQRIQDDLGAVVAAFSTTVAEARHERALSFTAKPSVGPLSRTLLRLRHDLVLVGRAATAPLPDTLAQRLGPPIAATGSSVSAFLAASAQALRSRQPPPPLAPVYAAMDAYNADVAAVRKEGLTLPLSTSEAERLFALGFAFDQMRRHLTDLQRCTGNWTAV